MFNPVDSKNYTSRSMLIGALGITQETCGNELLFKSVNTSVLFTKCGAYGSVYFVPLAEKGFQYLKARPVDIAS